MTASQTETTMFGILTTYSGDVAYVAAELLHGRVVLVADAETADVPATWATGTEAAAWAARVAEIDPSLPLTVVAL